MLWANQFKNLVYLNSNNYPIQRTFFNKGYKKLLAIGEKKGFNDILTFSKHIQNNNPWYFGYLNYDLKNIFEYLPSPKEHSINFPLFYFFEPEIVFIEKEDGIYVQTDLALEHIKNEILNTSISTIKNSPITSNTSIPKNEYIKNILKIKEHIQLGDVYELNFCQTFFAENTQLNPIYTYLTLNNISPTPFSALVKHHHQYILCASPERFLKKEGNTLFAQPIKGTSARSTDVFKDDLLKKSLFNSTKERSENVMIVDLMRNDLSKIAQKNTVQVNELFGIYSFPQVHQMISTISCKIKDNTSFYEIIQATFPMGSMTGAPKIKAMELINQYEPISRNIFSGSIGYIDPEGDFDLNVIIRSILYNRDKNYLSYSVGSAITIESDPELEYQECLLKAKAINQILGGI